MFFWHKYSAGQLCRRKNRVSVLEKLYTNYSQALFLFLLCHITYIQWCSTENRLWLEYTVRFSWYLQVLFQHSTISFTTTTCLPGVLLLHNFCLGPGIVGLSADANPHTEIV
jgi:hypothetical protein